MADDDKKTEEKTKQTVPALVRTAKGVAAHAAAVQEREYDRERNAFRNPITAMLALFAYAKITASLLDEAETRITLEVKARLQPLEARIAALEAWKTETIEQAAAMAREMEEMANSTPEEIAVKMRERLEAMRPPLPEVIDAPVVEPPIEVPPPVIDATVVSLPAKASRKNDKHEEKKGGAA